MDLGTSAHWLAKQLVWSFGAQIDKALSNPQGNAPPQPVLDSPPLALSILQATSNAPLPLVPQFPTIQLPDEQHDTPGTRRRSGRWW